jgi:uncharacterized protein YqeY
MKLEEKIMNDIKSAMLSKDTLKLEVCRSIKSAILLAKTEKKSQELTELKEIEILQKLFKQRQESQKIYLEQKRTDLAQHEENQATIIKEYLPQPYTPEELEHLINSLMTELGIASKQDMGKLISAVMSKAKGRADGRTISDSVKKKLN